MLSRMQICWYHCPDASSRPPQGSRMRFQLRGLTSLAFCGVWPGLSLLHQHPGHPHKGFLRSPHLTGSPSAFTSQGPCYILWRTLLAHRSELGTWGSPKCAVQPWLWRTDPGWTHWTPSAWNVGEAYSCLNEEIRAQKSGQQQLIDRMFSRHISEPAPRH